ncbi:MAG: methyl-accepting chemotaxis protein [Myxococcaceae bacterium]|nr:methyl-accepting chemotaxis protein [Myxococcaceae bacterium]
MLPSSVGNMVGAVLAAAYAFLTLDFPDAATRTTFLWLTCGLAAVFVVNAELWGMRRLSTLRALGAGTSPGNADTITRAMREVHPFPDFVAQISLGSWTAAVGSVALGTWLLTPAGPELTVRILAIGVLFAPITSALVNLLVTRRAQALLEKMTVHLSPAEVLAALPANTMRVGRRIVLFTVVLVVLPSAALIDVAYRLGESAFAALSRVDPDELDAALELARWALYGRLAVVALLVLGATLLVAYVGGTVIAGPLRRVALDAHRMAQGVLDAPRMVAANDEVWAITSSFGLLQGQLFTLVGKLQRAGEQLGVTTEQLMATSTRFEAGAADQAASLNETSATTEELATSARQISFNASEVSAVAQRTLEAAQGGQANAVAFGRAVERLKQDNRSIAEAVERLQRRVQQIGRIVEFINTVADRADLLALSAELEGTKAGDVGKGFSLVAGEMRRLAENVLESTNEVEQLIAEIHEATRATVEATQGGLTQTESGLALAGQVTVALNRVVGLAQQTSEAVRTISLATQQQQSGTDQLAEAMADILGITQQSLAATRQLTSANNELLGVANTLKAVTGRFEVKA